MTVMVMPAAAVPARATAVTTATAAPPTATAVTARPAATTTAACITRPRDEHEQQHREE